MSRKNPIWHRPNSVSLLFLHIFFQNMKRKAALAEVDAQRAPAVSMALVFAFDSLFAWAMPL